MVSKQTSLFLTQLQLQQNELKLKTLNAQNREKKFKVGHQINPVAEACRETVRSSSQAATTRTKQIQR